MYGFESSLHLNEAPAAGTALNLNVAFGLWITESGREVIRVLGAVPPAPAGAQLG